MKKIHEQHLQEADAYFRGLDWNLVDVAVVTAWCVAELNWKLRSSVRGI